MSVFLREDHDEVLKIWQKAQVNGLDLIHVDAHIDFVMYYARDPLEVFNSATSIKELKNGLEYTLAYLDYQKDLNKQTDIGNYIYPAMCQGLVKDFWWVVPGDVRSFEKNFKQLKDTFQRSFGAQKIKVIKKAKGLVFVESWGRRFWACVLETLPVLEHEVLLDIDTDFLVVPDIVKADNTCDIGKRQPWITPLALKDKLASKIKKPAITTIAYSTNGGFTPMKYRYLGDEIACRFSRDKFFKRFKRSLKAARYYRQFQARERRIDYTRAARLDPHYRAADNNFGPLYLQKRKFAQAQKEFLKVKKADPLNPACLMGLGDIALERKYFRQALKHYSSARRFSKDMIFRNERNQSLLGMGLAELELKNYPAAEIFLKQYSDLFPLRPEPYYFRGLIAQKGKDLSSSARLYKDCIRLGFPVFQPLCRLAKICCHIRDNQSIIQYLREKLPAAKKGLAKIKSPDKAKLFKIERIIRKYS